MDENSDAAMLSTLPVDWSIFDELAGKSEPELRRILRPHDEVGFDSGPDAGDHGPGVNPDAAHIELRRRLDAALDQLLVLEAGAETVELTGYLITVPFELNDRIGKLAASDSFLRFLDAYLYFGVRFLLGRTAAIRIAAQRQTQEQQSGFASKRSLRHVWQRISGHGRKEAAEATILSLTGKRLSSECNRVPASLKHPPVPVIVPFAKRQEAFDSFRALPVSGDEQKALAFLDGFHFSGPEGESAPEKQSAGFGPENETANYELWLRGLWHESPNSHGTEIKFEQLTRGLLAWVNARVAFYKTLEGGSAGIDSAWVARNPLTARFGVTDLYWIARILRADISSGGRVSYFHKSWLHLIADSQSSAGLEVAAAQTRTALQILRGVFDFACDLIQNSIELTEAAEAARLEPGQSPPAATNGAVKWREAHDEELDEIAKQKYLRTFRGSAEGFVRTQTKSRDEDGWSRRVRTGEYPAQEVVGLAFSGGGIRSATFGLGVLQGLQELDLLRSVDYLSTVSGGGYIGSWLVGNVMRTPHWLGRQTNWESAIGHLRRYSKYLSPHTGLLSADSWTMGGTWLRNAFLIQLMAFVWLVCILAACLAGKPVFDAVNQSPTRLGYSGEQIAHWTSGIIVAWIALLTFWNFWLDRPGPDWKQSFTELQVQKWLVAPAWAGAFLTSALLWAQATNRSAISSVFENTTLYSRILVIAWQPWISLLIAMFAGLSLLGVLTIKRAEAVAWSLIATVVVYLEYCGILWLFRQWAGDPQQYGWYAFVFGPVLTLLSASLAVIIFIAMCGRWSEDQTREWWTRMGSWLAMYGLGWMIIALSAVFGPLWILMLLGFNFWGVKWGALAGYAGTVLSGLFAGKSSKTSGTGSVGLEYLARLAAVLFIAGGLLGVSTVLYVFIVEAFTDFPIASSSPFSDLYWHVMNTVPGTKRLIVAGATLLIGFLLSWRVELNIFSLNYFYRNRLVRCYLGATRWRPGMRRPNKFTGFDEDDDIPLANLKQSFTGACDLPFRGPFPIVNCTLNLGGSEDLSVETRKSASFQLTPLRCGADRARVGYASTSPYAGGVKLGQAISVSGAAASPNMGYSSSTLVSFFLTMFNVRLGWWFPNPSGDDWKHARLPGRGFFYLLRELFGYADETSAFLNISDGGHFENLGIYELIRRQAKVIIASDGECDLSLTFGSLGNLVRICETDFGAKIEIDVSSIRKQDNGFSRAHCAVGRITYSNGGQGWLIYLKSSISGDEDVGVAQYRAGHPDFPHETTADQFFTEDQFESYRRLGLHVVQHTFRGTEPAARFTEVAQRLSELWTPAGFSSESFLTHTKTLETIWERFRDSKTLHPLLWELSLDRPQPPRVADPSPEELCACYELVQLMENVLIDLRLDDFWAHPDNRGWAMLFSAWAKSPTFRLAWTQIRRTFGIRFEYFCEERLGLEKEQPIARV